MSVTDQNKRKRVQFQEEVQVIYVPKDEDVVEVDDEDAENSLENVSTRLPVESFDPEDIEDATRESSRATDNSADFGVLAAAKRARLRTANGRNYVEELEAAEEDYKGRDHFDLIWEEGSGIPLEPFNLRREREEGYFDADGNYVEYRLQLHEDAWLAVIDELEMAPSPAQARQSQLLRQVIEPLNNGPTDQEAERQLHVILSCLQSGETVLDGLKRLGQPSQSSTNNAGVDGSPSGVSSGGKEATGGGAPKSRLQQQLARQRRVPEQNRAEFDRLTEAASSLMACGWYEVYVEPKEQLQKRLMAKEPKHQPPEASGDEVMLPAVGVEAPAPADPGLDMFAHDIDIESTGTTHSSATHVSHVSYASSPHVGEPCKRPEAQSTSADVGMADLDAPKRNAAAGQLVPGAGRTDDVSAQAGGGVEAAPQGDGVQMKQAGQPINADLADVARSQSDLALEGSQQESGDVEMACGALVRDKAAEQQVLGNAASPGEYLQDAVSEEFRVAPAAVHRGNAEIVGGGQAAALPSGFEHDGDSGLLYNSDMGMFFDPASGTFRDANTGLWYTCDNGVWAVVRQP